MGVAKKIKNGARKIVLEKAEEARIAAFSAFKSLGLNVPQFSRPILSTATENSTGEEEAATTAPRNDKSSSFIFPAPMEHSDKPSLEANQISKKVDLESAGEKLLETSDNELSALVEGGSITELQQKFDAENPPVPFVGPGTGGVEFNVNASEIKIPDTTLSVQLGKNAIGTITSNRDLDLEVQDQPNRDPCLVNKDRACNKGPINAINASGGFDCFLDRWEATHEFYFDIHYDKHSEANSGVLFEIHGLAVCWENSPVYYVNLPKDLWSDHRRKDRFLIYGSSDKNVLTPEHQLEMIKQRWKRIGEIMEKRDVRKFTWNMKVQIQVLKHAAVSIQRFGGHNLVGTSLGLEIVGSSFLLLSPVHLKDGIDMCIVSWILWPDDERSSNPNLEKVIFVSINKFSNETSFCKLF